MKYRDLWDMPLGGKTEERQVPHKFGNIVYVVVGFVFKIAFRYRVDHRENLRAFKDRSGVMVVCNHTSFLDVMFIYLSARLSQWMRFVARDKLFTNGHGLLGWMLARCGAFPIKRDSADRTAIKRAVKMLKRNEPVAIMPEGTRRGKGNIEPKLHGGAALIAKMADVPILPMTVRNAELVKEKGKFIRFPKITIDYGTPILLADFDFLPKEQRLEGCTWYAMRRCFAMSKRISDEEVDMVGLFPDCFDYAKLFLGHPIPEHTSEEVIQMREQKLSRKAKEKQDSAGDDET